MVDSLLLILNELNANPKSISNFKSLYLEVLLKGFPSTQAFEQFQYLKIFRVYLKNVYDYIIIKF